MTESEKLEKVTITLPNGTEVTTPTVAAAAALLRYLGLALGTQAHGEAETTPDPSYTGDPERLKKCLLGLEAIEREGRRGIRADDLFREMGLGSSRSLSLLGFFLKEHAPRIGLTREQIVHSRYVDTTRGTVWFPASKLRRALEVFEGWVEAQEGGGS